MREGRKQNPLMKPFFLLRIFFGITAVVGLASCSHVTPGAQTQGRILEKSAAYNALKPREQENILGGAIERGNTTDMVYMALGKPSKIVTSADGTKAMWVYVEYYSPTAAFTTGFNNPNSTRYTPQIINANTKPPPMIAVPSYNAPLHTEGSLPIWLMPQVFGSTGNATPVQSLDVPDMLTKTVYVFFFHGKVAEIKLDGDSRDQVGAAPNAAPRKSG
jgi:hypothetical protein